MATTETITWDAVHLEFKANGAVIPWQAVKGGADAVTVEAQARIRVLADQLRAGDITLEQWYQQMQVNTKMLAGAESALARGGFDNMRPQDWDKAGDVALEQWEGKPDKFPGLRKFGEDISKGRYTPNGTDILSNGFSFRANMYADAGHAIYENTRTDMHVEKGFVLASRELSAVDNCPDCVAWADLGKISIEDMQNDYPIASSVCGSNCRCSISYYGRGNP